VTAPTPGVLAPATATVTWAVVAVVLVVLTVVTVVCVVRARRLDWLHRRTDAARAGLADALERRAAVALRVADALAAGEIRPPPTVAPHGLMRSPGAGAEPPHVTMRRRGGAEHHADGLRAAAHDGLAACRVGLRSAGAGLELCEVAENTLTRRLAAVDRGALPSALTGELVDAEQLVLLARRVHNDAVRDTLDLRSRRLVRWLRLAGTAPPPAYFEIADPPPGRPRPVAGPSEVTGSGVAG
jgi:hypothetical protein